MSVRRSLSALAAATGCVVSSAVLAAAPAHADTAPWADGTVFVASTGMRTGYDGGLAAIAPNGGVSHLGYGSAQDVAVDAAGTVYWVTCSGNVSSFTPPSTSATLATGLGCLTGIAVEPNGKLLVSGFSGMYEMDSDGGNRTTAGSGVYSSMTFDPAGDLFAADGTDVDVRVAGSSSFQRILGLPVAGSLLTVRLTGDSSLLVGYTGGAAIIPLDGSAPQDYPIASYTEGATIDQAGDIWVSDVIDNPSTQDQVDYIPAGTTTPSVLATGFDTPRGLAVYPVVVPAARSGSSVSVSMSRVNQHHQARLTASVDGGAATNGLVQFAIDGSPVNDVATVSGGTASTLAFLPKGTHNITATYLGSATENPSQSASLPYTVRAVATTTTLSTASTTVPQADPVTVTATVTGRGPAEPTGEVSFYVNGRFTTSADVDGSGQATTSVQLPAGSPRVSAKYSGNDIFGASATTSLTFTTTAPYTSSTSVNVRYGTVRSRGWEGMTLVVTVNGRAGGPQPTGTVSADQGFTCSALTPMTSVRASRSTCRAVLPPNYYNVDISYSGDPTYAASGTSADFYTGGGG